MDASVSRASLPVLDLGPLREKSARRAALAREIDEACRAYGFFYVSNHGVDEALLTRLETLSREYFAKPASWKQEMGMSRGGAAWRGYFPLGGELTSGKPDRKEGIYFGSEGKPGLPLHGPNLFPKDFPEFRSVVLQYLEAMTRLGHQLMEGIALALQLAPDYFHSRYTADPLILFRIFHYPPLPPSSPDWGVGEHTDYGVLTILRQDDCGGLEVKTPQGWIAAPPIPGTFVCNLGDMLDRMTGGRYRSTPHRVRNLSGKDRLSFPFFFDPNFNADVRAIALPDDAPARDDRDERWDRESVHAFQGTYGEYLMRKIGKVFPDLGNRVLK